MGSKFILKLPFLWKYTIFSVERFSGFLHVPSKLSINSCWFAKTICLTSEKKWSLPKFVFFYYMRVSSRFNSIVSYYINVKPFSLSKTSFHWLLNYKKPKLFKWFLVCRSRIKIWKFKSRYATLCVKRVMCNIYNLQYLFPFPYSWNKMKEFAHFHWYMYVMLIKTFLKNLNIDVKLWHLLWCISLYFK